MLSKYFPQIRGGEVKTFVFTDVIEAISQLEQYEISSFIEGKVVVQTWENIPEHEAVLQEILHVLARVALAIWPTWYGQKVAFCFSEERPLEDALLNQFKLRDLQATRQEVCLPWLKNELAEHTELDSILYGAISLPSIPEQGASRATEEEFKHVIWPIRGKPHPFSPGEQLLARKLLQDPELADLFLFNQSVETSRGKRYLVDLLWLEGKVVVEIDGYRHHGNSFAFVEDRHRDYELLISGYVVLRLPHDEVVNDIEIAVEKIRDVVKFRHSQQLIIK